MSTHRRRWCHAFLTARRRPKLPPRFEVLTALVAMGRRTRAVRGRRLVSLPKSAESTRSNTRLSLVSALPTLAGGMRAIDDEVDTRSAGKCKHRERSQVSSAISKARRCVAADRRAAVRPSGAG